MPRLDMLVKLAGIAKMCKSLSPYLLLHPLLLLVRLGSDNECCQATKYTSYIESTTEDPFHLPIMGSCLKRARNASAGNVNDGHSLLLTRLVEIIQILKVNTETGLYDCKKAGAYQAVTQTMLLCRTNRAWRPIQ